MSDRILCCHRQLDETLPLDDRHLRATFTTRFLVRLNQLADKGTIERIGSGVRWRVASEA